MNEIEENNVEKKIESNGETVKTFNKAKVQGKIINLKEKAKEGKILLKDLIATPLKTVKEIAEDKENKNFKIALLLIVLWAVIELMDQILYYAMSKYAEFEFLPTLKATLTPVLQVIAMSMALYLVNDRAKDSISKVLTSVSIAYIPSIISALLWLLYHVSTKISYILSPISGILSIVSLFLLYYTVKEYTKENEEATFKKFIKVVVVYYIIAFVISFLGISI